MDPRDEQQHPVGDDPAWSESYYFNVADPARELGMFMRMGFRANEGTVDGLMGIYLGGHRVAFIYAREALPEPYDTLCASGLSLECVEPFMRWRVTFDGPAQDIADDHILVTRRKERPEGWFTPVTARLDVVFEALNEPYYTPGSGQRGHFEQAGTLRGTIAVGDERWEVDGYGVRDKSWGPRTWQAGSRSAAAPQGSEPRRPSPFVNWFSMNFGDRMAMGASCGRRDGEMQGAGWIWRDGRNLALEDIRVTSEYEPGSILHRSLVLTGTDSEGVAHQFDGTLITVTPTKIAMPGAGATFVNEGFGRFIYEGQTGYGIAEYWHTVR